MFIYVGRLHYLYLRQNTINNEMHDLNYLQDIITTRNIFISSHAHLYLFTTVLSLRVCISLVLDINFLCVLDYNHVQQTIKFKV